MQISVKHFQSFSHVVSILYWLHGNSVRFGHKYNNGTIYINTNAMMYHLIVIVIIIHQWLIEEK
jgi:hypothetical protein